MKSFHFRICGETGSGKSTLTRNLINCLNQIYGEQIQTILIDPKYPLSDWDIPPQFPGIESSMQGLQSLAREVESRLALAKLDKELNQPIRQFNPILFVIDEIDWIASEYKKDASSLLKIGLKVGRALNVKVIYLGQTPLCSALYLNRNDFKNSTSILLGEMALLGINEVCYNRQKSEIESQLELRQSESDDYYALVKPMGQSPFTAILPSPGYYTWDSPKPLQGKDLQLSQDTISSEIVQLKPDIQDSVKLERLQVLKEQLDIGESRKGVLIPLLWGNDYKQGSRLYRNVLKEFEMLVNEVKS